MNRNFWKHSKYAVFNQTSDQIINDPPPPRSLPMDSFFFLPGLIPALQQPPCAKLSASPLSHSSSCSVSHATLCDPTQPSSSHILKLIFCPCCVPALSAPPSPSHTHEHSRVYLRLHSSSCSSQSDWSHRGLLQPAATN